MADKRMTDAFHAFLTGDTLEQALTFADFVEASGMVYDGAYEIHYRDTLACYIDTPIEARPTWRVWTVGDFSAEYEGFPVEARTKEIAWANVLKCGNCADVNCDPGKTEVVFGKAFENVCNGVGGLAMRFDDPDAKALACAEKLIEMTRYHIDHHAG